MLSENYQHSNFLERPLTSQVPMMPPYLIYNNEKMTSIIPYVKEIKYSPNTGLTYRNGQTIKFLLNSTGFIDPYGTYLNFDIYNIDKKPLQFDGSAHSLISSLIISSNGNVIEEINDYDIIQNVIFDSTLSDKQRACMTEHGFGYNEQNNYEGTKEPVIFNESLINYLNNGVEPNHSLKITDALFANTMVNNPNELLYNTDRCGYHIYKGKVDHYPKENCMRISLPIMSNIFGFALNINNYRWIPLEIFPNLEISITLSNYALFQPIPSSIETVFVTNPGRVASLNKQTSSNTSTHITNATAPTITNEASAVIIRNWVAQLIEGENTRNYELKNVSLQTTQLFFDSSILIQIRDMALKNGFTLETSLYQSFQQKMFKSAPDQTYVLNVPRKSIRSLITVFQNRIYENAACMRKQKRYSRGITKMQVKVGEDYYPFLPIEGDSSTSYGLISNSQFIKAWDKTFYRQAHDLGDSIITPFNYAIDTYQIDAWHTFINTAKGMAGNDLILALQNACGTGHVNNFYNNNFRLLRGLAPNVTNNAITPYTSNRITSHEQLCYGWSSELVGRSIFAISLDQLPMSGNLYKSGVDTRFTKPIILEIQQDPTVSSTSVGSNLYTQYVFLHFDYTIKISYNGFITKDF